MKNDNLMAISTFCNFKLILHVYVASRKAWKMQQIEIIKTHSFHMHESWLHFLQTAFIYVYHH